VQGVLPDGQVLQGQGPRQGDRDRQPHRQGRRQARQGIVGKGAIKSGKVTLTLKKLKKGKNKLTATYAGDSKFAASKLKFKITVK
jgi:hypothetical protein